MSNAVLMVGFGAVAIAISFGLATRARDTEWRNDPWDMAGALLKILGTLAVLIGLALFIPPPRNLEADPSVGTHTLSSQGSGLRLRLPRSSAPISLGGETGGLPDSPKP